MLKVLKLAVVAASLLVAVQTHVQGAILMTMDDLPFQPVDGLVHPNGVTFGFTVGGIPDLDANFASGGPGTSTYVSDPSIEGTTAGVLEVILPGVFSVVEFGLVVSGGGPTSVDVTLFDGSNALLGVFSLSLTDLGFFFAENQFSFSGPGVSRFLVDMTPASGAAGRFAFDNLLLDSAAVPEPGTMTLVGLGAMGLAAGAIRRRRQRA